MASIKALAAIGLMIVIVAPIGLGYVFAIDEGETTGWETVDRSNISDLILNSETAYTMDYAGPSNNSQLVVSKYSPGSGTWAEVVAPDYTEVGSVYTSLPEYSETSGTKALTPSDRFSYTVTDRSIGVGPYSIPITGDYLAFSVDSSATSAHWQFEFGSRYVATKEPTVAIRDGPGTYTVYNSAIPGGVAKGVATFGYVTDATGQVVVAKSYYTTMGIGGTYTFTLNAYGLELTKQGGGKEYVSHYGGLSAVTVSSMGTVTAGGTVYEQISAVAVATSAGASTISYTSVTPTGLYASPSEGWTVPTDVVSAEWTNGAKNAAVRLYVTMEGHTVTIAKQDGATSYPAVEITATGGTVSVGGKVLGTYPALMVTADRDGYTVTGIMSWPSMGGPVEGYNSITVDAPSGTFDGLRLGGDRAKYRVDSAEIVAGYFASTADYTLDLESLYPGKSLLVEFAGIGVYGDYLDIGSHRYAVEDGRISIDGRSYPVKGIRIGAMETDGMFSVTVNGDEIATTEDMPSITLGGEWSLGAVIYTLQETTIKTYSWIPGGFAFDKQSLGAAGLLCCGIAFLVLGLTGKAGGPKVALLGLVLGGAATVYLIIL